jgi:geranylgeranyl reductase
MLLWSEEAPPVPPRLISDFNIPDHVIAAKINTARMISPTQRAVDIPIKNGFVGMVDREHIDEFLRVRAVKAGAIRHTGTFLRVEYDFDGKHVVFREKEGRHEGRLTTKLIIGADGARSDVARAEVKGGSTIPCVIAYHEIIQAPAANANYDPKRCDVIYDGAISPDFYGWVFPHGTSASVGKGAGKDGVDLKKVTADSRAVAGLTDCVTIRREGAPIPLRPLDRWDNGRDVVLAGAAATAATACLKSKKIKDLQLARKFFTKEHKPVFKILGAMQNAYYRSDERRKRFVSLCHDVDVQKLTFEAYMKR